MGPSAKESVPGRKERSVSTPRPLESANDNANANDKPSGPRSRKGVETRARLVAAAKEIFERDGFLDARISDIAERAGLSHGSFYHYFESKEEVFREVATEVDARLSAPMNTVILDPASTLTPAERIREALRIHLQSYRDEARIMGVIEQVSRFDPDVRASRTERHYHYHRAMTDSIRSLQRHGLADADLDPDVTAAALGSMTYRFPEMWFVEGLFECDFDWGVEQFTRVFVRALGLENAAPDQAGAGTPAGSAKVAGARSSS
jgi:AcrR family transcriptional regulator